MQEAIQSTVVSISFIIVIKLLHSWWSSVHLGNHRQPQPLLPLPSIVHSETLRFKNIWLLPQYCQLKWWRVIYSKSLSLHIDLTSSFWWSSYPAQHNGQLGGYLTTGVPVQMFLASALYWPCYQSSNHQAVCSISASYHLIKTNAANYEQFVDLGCNIV